MLSTKSRTIISAFVASAGIAIASAPLAPAASAAPRSGGGTVSKWNNTCADAQISFENAITLTEGQAEMGEKASAERSLALATKIAENAKASGCKVL